MKSVQFDTYTRLGCGCNSDVVICTDEDLTESGAPYIDARIVAIDSVQDSNGRTIFRYTFIFDDGLLVDPNYNFATCDITGAFCRNCLTDYIDYNISQVGGSMTVTTAVFEPIVVVAHTSIGAAYASAETLPANTKWVKIQNATDGDVYVSMDGGVSDNFLLGTAESVELDLQAWLLTSTANIQLKDGPFAPTSGSVLISSIH